QGDSPVAQGVVNGTKVEGWRSGRNLAASFAPGTWLLLMQLIPDLRPGLTYAAAPRLGLVIVLWLWAYRLCRIPTLSAFSAFVVHAFGVVIFRIFPKWHKYFFGRRYFVALWGTTFLFCKYLTQFQGEMNSVPGWGRWDGGVSTWERRRVRERA